MKIEFKGIDQDHVILVTSITALISLIFIIITYEKSSIHLISFAITFTVSMIITVYQISKIEVIKHGND